MEYFVRTDDISFIVETSKRDITEELIDQLVECRKSKRLTQQDIADATGIKRANIARLESCAYTPTIEVLIKYATALNCRLTFDLQEVEDQREGRNKETTVDMSYIEGGEYRRKFDSLTDSKELNRLIYNKAKEMLKHRSGTEYEDMYWFDYDAKDVLCYKLDEIVTGEIRHTKAIDSKLKNCQHVIAVHTHPHSMPPSPEDFNCFYVAGYDMAIIICHDGSVYRYSSTETIEVDLWAAYYIRESKKNISDLEAQNRTLNKFVRQGVIKYKEVLV